MSNQSDLLISVRGEARETVAPDYASLEASILAIRASKPEAVREVASGLERLKTDMDALGGEPLTAASERSPLTWSAYSSTTDDETNFDSKAGQRQPTGRTVAAVQVRIMVRAVDLLDRLGAVLARHDDLHLRSVSWHVDHDNPAWSRARTGAVQAAVRKASDYAAALGGSLSGIEQLADTGLMAEGDTPKQVFRAAAGAARQARGDDLEAPSLDPVPQELRAAVEARFTATGVTVERP
ncbi:MAG: SIMPL domain-containing protein [Acidimicrobiales bacterium]